MDDDTVDDTDDDTILDGNINDNGNIGCTAAGCGILIVS